MRKLSVLVILFFLPFVVNAKCYKNETLSYAEKQNITSLVTENYTASIVKLDKAQNVMIPENPKTGDGIGLIVIGVVVSLVGICVAVMLIKED